jgi:choline transport protein
VASWFTGWISIGGQIVLTASAAFAAGLQFLSLVNLNNPEFVSQRWQGMLFYWFILTYVLALSVWGSRILSHANVAAGVLHIMGFVVIVIVLGVMTEDKHTAEYVFTEVSNTSGWQSGAISWLVGLLSTVYPFLG